MEATKSDDFWTFLKKMNFSLLRASQLQMLCGSSFSAVVSTGRQADVSVHEVSRPQTALEGHNTIKSLRLQSSMYFESMPSVCIISSMISALVSLSSNKLQWFQNEESSNKLQLTCD